MLKWARSQPMQPASDQIVDKMREKALQYAEIVVSGWPGKCLTGTLALF